MRFLLYNAEHMEPKNSETATQNQPVNEPLMVDELTQLHSSIDRGPAIDAIDDQKVYRPYEPLRAETPEMTLKIAQGLAIASLVTALPFYPISLLCSIIAFLLVKKSGNVISVVKVALIVDLIIFVLGIGYILKIFMVDPIL